MSDQTSNSPSPSRASPISRDLTLEVTVRESAAGIEVQPLARFTEQQLDYSNLPFTQPCRSTGVLERALLNALGATPPGTGRAPGIIGSDHRDPRFVSHGSGCEQRPTLLPAFAAGTDIRASRQHAAGVLAFPRRSLNHAMQTTFSLAQLADPDVRESEKILRACVHCGFCTATCPTYVLLGDELDSPRGRIYLIKDMLENAKPASERVVTHIDRCLSCLACMTTCPSGVHYMHLVDHARRYIEETYTRPWPDRLLRSAARGGAAAALVCSAWRCAPPRSAAPCAACCRRAWPACSRSRRSACRRHPRSTAPQVFPAAGTTARARRAARRLRAAGAGAADQRGDGPPPDPPRGRGGRSPRAPAAAARSCITWAARRQALAAARANIDAWERERANAGLDAVIINASGCGTTVKDYGFMLREDPAYAEKAARIAALARDVTELLAELGLQPPERASDLVVAYHSACSMQHGQRITAQPKDLLRAAGFTVKDIPEGHICCGSAGTYNLLQPALAGQLRERKLANIARVRPDVVATGNIGCMVQLAGGACAGRAHGGAARLGDRRACPWRIGGAAIALDDRSESAPSRTAWTFARPEAPAGGEREARPARRCVRASTPAAHGA